MKYLKQWMMILIFTLLGELLKAILPFQIPAGIYGLILMFFCLWSGILRKDQIQETAGFLLHIMPVMFIPAAAGILQAGEELRKIWVPALFAAVIVTAAVMAVSAAAAQKTSGKGE